jgi:acyl-coenzyme A synthetase/AMP-(fatty) acid ligase
MPSPDVVHVLASADPLAAFAEARDTGRLLALPTAGTSDRPRTILRTTDSWVRSFAHVSRLLGLDASTRVWIPGPLDATMNLFAAVHTGWTGATRVADPRAATHAHLTPAALRRELATRPTDLAGVHVLTAGDRLERTTYDNATAAGVRVSHYYGAAELSFVAWGHHADALRPFPGVEVDLRGGELWVRSPYLCERYLETDRALRRDDRGWMSVGDRGRLADGLVTVLGREGGITTGGSTVLVADIEHQLRPHAVGELVVVGIPHPDLGEVVAAAVSRPEDVERLRAVSRRDLAPAQRPRRWLHLDPLPLTANGKIDRRAVATAAAGSTVAGASA